MKKAKVFLSFAIIGLCLGCAILLGGCKDDNNQKPEPVPKTVTVTYDYNFKVDDSYKNDFSIADIYNNYTTSKSGEEEVVLDELPTIRTTSNAVLDGWYDQTTGEKVQIGDSITNDTVLQAKYEVLPSGAYKSGAYLASWNKLMTKFPNAIMDNDPSQIIFDYNFPSLTGADLLVIDNSVSHIKFNYSVRPDLFISKSVLSMDFANGNFNGKVEIDKNNPNFTEIDGGIYNKKVTKLYFYTKPNVKVVKNIPSSVVEICDGAFDFHHYMTEVVIPDSVQTIGKGAFRSCVNLRHVTMSKNVKTIPESCFEGCTRLEDITFIDNIQTIEANAFADCRLLSYVRFGTKITSLDKTAFSNCRYLEYIVIHNSYMVGFLSEECGLDYVKEINILSDLNVEGCTFLLENFTKGAPLTDADGVRYEQWARKTA